MYNYNIDLDTSAPCPNAITIIQGDTIFQGYVIFAEAKNTEHYKHQHKPCTKGGKEETQGK